MIFLGDGEFDGTRLRPAECDGLVLRVPDGHEHDGDVGGRTLSPRCFRGVSSAGEADGLTGGLCHP